MEEIKKIAKELLAENKVQLVVGFEKGKPGGTIVRCFDLKKMGIAWEPYGPLHAELTSDIKKIIKAG